MRFQITTVAALVALSSALPTLKVRQAGPVLADTTYDAISISGGQAGDAEAEALAVFSALDTANPENIDEADLAFLGAVNDVANDAETDAFNPAIEAATGAEAEALEAGKTKNKVLKLMATKIELEAKQAQGEDVAAKLEEELTKLNNNIATDQENAGNPSTAVAFDATVSGGGNAAAAGNNNNANNGGNADNDDDAAADDDAGNNDAGNDDAANDDAANDDAANDDAGDNNQDQDAGNNNNNQDQDQDAGNNNNQDAGNNNNNQDQDQDQDAGNNNNANNNNNGGNNNAGNNNAGNNNAGSGATGNFLFGGN